MGGKSSTPATPDYQGLAQQQGQISSNLLNQQTASNRSDTSTPYGSTSWKAPTTPGGQWTGSETLNPTLQATLQGQEANTQAQTGIQGQEVGGQQNLFNSFNNSGGYSPIDYSNVPSVQGGNYYDQNAQNAVWNQFQNMEQPLQGQQTEQQQSQLEGQGLRPGDAAYDTAMKNLSNTQFQQTQTAQDQAVLAGEQAAQSNQGMDVQAQNSDINLANQKLNNVNMYNSLMGGGPGQLNPSTMPTTIGATNAGVAQTPDLTGAAQNTYGSQLNATNASNAASGNLWQGLGSAATMAAMFLA